MFSSLAEFWNLSRPFKRWLVGLAMLLTFDALLVVFSVVSVAPLADLLLDRPETEWLSVTVQLQTMFNRFGIPFDLLTMGLVFLGLTLLMAVFSVFVRWMMVRLRIFVVRHLIDSSLQKMFAASWGVLH